MQFIYFANVTFPNQGINRVACALAALPPSYDQVVGADKYCPPQPPYNPHAPQ